jgi:protein TonB
VGLLGLLVTGHSRAQIGPNATAQAGAPVAPAAIAPDSVYVNPEVRPQFTGGDKAFISS